jgi:hypothetical protein
MCRPPVKTIYTEPNVQTGMSSMSPKKIMPFAKSKRKEGKTMLTLESSKYLDTIIIIAMISMINAESEFIIAIHSVTNR